MPSLSWRKYCAWMPVLVIATVLVVLLAGAAGLRFIKAQLVASAGESLSLAASDIAGKLDLLMAERYGDVQIMAKAAVFRGQDHAAMTEVLQAMQEAYPVYLWLGVTDARGRIVAATDPASVGRNRSGSAWFQAVRDRDGISVSDAAVSEESEGVLAVSFAAPIRGPRGEFRGAVITLVGLPVLEDVFMRTVVALQAQHGTQTRVEYQFLTGDGTLIADSILREDGRVNLRQLGVLSAGLVDSAPAGTVVEEHGRRRMPVITGYAKTKGAGAFPGLGWGVLVRIDLPDILNPIDVLLWKLAAAGGLVCLPMLGYLLWTTGRLKTEWTRSEELIGKLQSAEASLNELAHYDLLTALPNRRLFMNLLTKALARAGRTKRLVALMFLDLDRFKLINDTLGHACADLLLKAFAARLTSCVRTTDTVSRLGGDEFTIILEDLPNAEDAALVARRILDNMALPFSVGGRELFVTSSIGIALFPLDCADADSLIINADTAMYAAKERRAAFQFFSPTSMNPRTDERLGLETGLHHALQRQEFLLHYQPQVDVRNGTIVGVEALIRWRHPDQGLVPPGAFIPLAEETGMIVPIGEWVLRTACAQVKTWQTSGGSPLRLAVNLSRRQFQQSNLVETVRRILLETDFDPRFLELEITESLLIHDTDRIIDTLHALHDLGIRLSIDDFGTGYSSLSYLKHLPVTALKIDQSFVRHVTTSARDAAIVKAIITLVRCLNLEVIAEGVETKQQEAALRAEQCFEMQGYYFGRPSPAEELTARLAQREGSLLVH